MKCAISLLACVIYLVAASAARAECTGVLCTSVLIETLYVESGEGNSDVWVQTSGTESALNCTANSGTWLKLSGSVAAKKEVYALLSMAFAMDKPIGIRVIDNSADCLISYAYLTR